MTCSEVALSAECPKCNTSVMYHYLADDADANRLLAANPFDLITGMLLDH